MQLPSSHLPLVIVWARLRQMNNLTLEKYLTMTTFFIMIATIVSMLKLSKYQNYQKMTIFRPTLRTFVA